MKINQHLAIACGLAALLSAPVAVSAEGYVIVNAATQLSADDVRDVFTGEKQMAGSSKIVPLDNANLQAAFLARVLGVDKAKYANIWVKKGFREGLNPPQVKLNDGEVVAAVKQTVGAVGYVSSAPAGVRVLREF